MWRDPLAKRLGEFLFKRRTERGLSQKMLADAAGVKASVVNRAEAGGNAKIRTWERLFMALEHILQFDSHEWEEKPGWHEDEQFERYQRRLAGLCAGKRRFY